MFRNLGHCFKSYHQWVNLPLSLLPPQVCSVGGGAQRSAPALASLTTWETLRRTSTLPSTFSTSISRTPQRSLKASALSTELFSPVIRISGYVDTLNKTSNTETILTQIFICVTFSFNKCIVLKSIWTSWNWSHTLAIVSSAVNLKLLIR